MSGIQNAGVNADGPAAMGNMPSINSTNQTPNVNPAPQPSMQSQPQQQQQQTKSQPQQQSQANMQNPSLNYHQVLLWILVQQKSA